MTIITAIYKNGKFEPLQPITILDNTRVLLQIQEQDRADAEIPLIDGIPINSDPELYARAASLGARAYGLHAWQLLPMKYKQGEDGRPQRMRDYVAEGLDPLDYLQELAVDMPDVPEDFAENVDHYLYGLPQQSGQRLHDKEDSDDI